MSTSKILIIAPHPDDFVISCSGFVLKHGSKYVYDVLLMASEGILPSTDVRLSEETVAISRIESVIGKGINHIIFPQGMDTQLHTQFNDMVSYIQSLVTESIYERIFIPYHEDTHQDHLSVNQAALAACRYQRNILLYETPSTLRFLPTVFSELNETQLKNKVNISSSYKSQILGSAGIDKYELTLGDYITSKALSNGALSRTCKYAEGYTPHRLYI